MNYLNLMSFFFFFVVVQDGQPWIFRLVAVSCISLALKMRKTDFSVSDLMVMKFFKLNIIYNRLFIYLFVYLGRMMEV